MNVMEEIIKALNEGRNETFIRFPSGLYADDRVAGNYDWSDVARKLVEMIQSEGVDAEYDVWLNPASLFQLSLKNLR